jgi:hypothetical protein
MEERAPTTPFLREPRIDAAAPGWSQDFDLGPAMLRDGLSERSSR